MKPAVVYRGNDIEKEGFDIEKEGDPENKIKLLSGNLKFYQEGNKVKNITMDSYGVTFKGEPVCIEALCAKLSS